MPRKNTLLLFLFLPAVCCLVPAMLQAEVQTIVSTIRQPFGGSLSADDARVTATARARRAVLEKAGPYIERLTVVKNQAVKKEDIPALAAGMLETEIVSQKSYVTDDAFAVEVTAGIKVNTAILEAQAARLLKDNDLLKNYQDIRKREAGLLSRMNTLEAENRKLKPAPSEKEENALRQKFQKTANALSAVDWYKQAVDLTNHQTDTNKIPEEAERLLHTAIKLDPEYGAAFLWLGKIYSKKGEYDRAVEYFQKALDADLKALGANHPDLGAAYNRLGLACHRNDALDRALEAYHAAWKIQVTTLGENHPDVATTYNNMGETWRLKGRYDRAIEYYKKDLEISLKALGRNHPSVATSYNNLGYAYHGKGENDRAIEYFQKALAIYRTTLGENHSQTKAVRENIEFLKTEGR